LALDFGFAERLLRSYGMLEIEIEKSIFLSHES